MISLKRLLAALAALVLLPACFVRGPCPAPAARADGADRGAIPTRQAPPATFDVTVKGVLDSSIEVTFPAVLGKEFSARRQSEGGQRVEVRGTLRSQREGGYFLNLSLTETDERCQKLRALSTSLAPGKAALVCRGWVYWYELKITPAR